MTHLPEVFAIILGQAVHIAQEKKTTISFAYWEASEGDGPEIYIDNHDVSRRLAVELKDNELAIMCVGGMAVDRAETIPSAIAWLLEDIS